MLRLKDMAKPKKQRGGHALRKRCPQCRKIRRWHEPPLDQGGSIGRLQTAKRWRKRADGKLICQFCVAREVCPECKAGPGKRNISYWGSKPGDVDHMNAHICTNKWHKGETNVIRG